MKAATSVLFAVAMQMALPGAAAAQAAHIDYAEVVSSGYAGAGWRAEVWNGRRRLAMRRFAVQ